MGPMGHDFDVKELCHDLGTHALYTAFHHDVGRGSGKPSHGKPTSRRLARVFLMQGDRRVCDSFLCALVYCCDSFGYCCVAMRHWTLEDNIQYGGHFTSHLVDFGLSFKTMRGQKSEG